MAFSFIEPALQQRQSEHLYRKLNTVQSKQSRYVYINGKQYLNFSSNDYLGLASDPEMIKAWQKGAELYGVGSGGSYLVTGYHQVHHDLTQQLKEWLGLTDLCFFSSGYSANQAMVSLLLNKHDLLIQDKLNHASLMEAGQHSAAKMSRFKHNDLNHLSHLLEKQSQIDNKLVITEGVFSMDGDNSPVTDINTLCKRHDAWLMVDDAHGIGVLGEQGKGSLNAQGMDNTDCEIYMGTFGKALGVGGAFVSGSPQLIDYITNFSKHYIYTTGLSPAMAYCIGEAAKMAQQQQWRRDHLMALIDQFKQLAGQFEIPLMPSNTPIQPVLIGNSETALNVAKCLKENGIWVTAIRPPTVPENSARLRITLTVNHTKQDITYLAQQLQRAVNANSN